MKRTITSLGIPAILASLRERTTTLATKGTLRDNWQQWTLLLIALVSALMMRKYLLPHFTGDFTYFMLPWFDHLKLQGFYGLGQEFANYNVPYLYLLYITTKLPLEALEAVKLISGVFDLVLAAGVVAIVFHFRRSTILAGLVGIAFLFLPEVLLNSGMWGQVDGIFTSFLVWTAYFVLTRKDILAWVCFTIAFEFKLQALFFLPWILLAFIIQKHRWRAIAFAVGTALVCYVPALIAGRSVGSLAGIYLEQIGTDKDLTRSAVNLYQWIPNSLFEIMQPAGVFLALGSVSLLTILYLRRSVVMPDKERWLVQVAAGYGVLVPFVLPQMHERYFFTAGVFVALCALLDRKYLVPALVLQFTAVIAYAPFVFATPTLVPLGIAAIVQLAAVAWVIWLSLTPIAPNLRPFFPQPDHEVRSSAHAASVGTTSAPL